MQHGEHCSNTSRLCLAASLLTSASTGSGRGLSATSELAFTCCLSSCVLPVEDSFHSSLRILSHCATLAAGVPSPV